METFLIVFQILLGILIILIVLVNVTKGSEYGAVFRGAEAIFGGAGPTSFLNKVTMVLAVLFFLNSLLLTKISAVKHKSSLIEVPPVPKTNTSPPPIPPTVPSTSQQKAAPSEKSSSKVIPVPPRGNLETSKKVSSGKQKK
jgi:preprotein translocase subunit SecG